MTRNGVGAEPFALDARRIVAFHEACLDSDHWPEEQVAAHPHGALWPWIEANHINNARLWREEDLARRRQVRDAEIAANKRAIDRLNQLRNDAIERCDDVLMQALQHAMADAPRLHSETPGMMIDRLSILSLKVRAMREQSVRGDVEEGHRARCRDRLEVLMEQREDLAKCLDALVADCRAGHARFKEYRQFKMYNDAALNPSVYGER